MQKHTVINHAKVRNGPGCTPMSVQQSGPARLKRCKKDNKSQIHARGISADFDMNCASKENIPENADYGTFHLAARFVLKSNVPKTKIIPLI